MVIEGNIYSWGTIPSDGILSSRAGWAMEHTQAWAMGLVSQGAYQGVLSCMPRQNIPGSGSVTPEFWEPTRRGVWPQGCVLCQPCQVQGLCSHQGKVKVTQSFPTLCNPMDYQLHEILQARILEWIAIPFFRGSTQPRDQT